MKESIEDRILGRLKGFTEALENKEVISEKFTCRKVVLTLEPTPYKPDLVKRTRNVLGASQAIFAQFLGVSTSTVQAWEQGENTPNVMACRFMDEIRVAPDYWRERLRNLVVPKESGAC